MGARTFWILLLVLCVLPGGLWLLTEVRMGNGDPVIYKHCWILGGHHHHASEGLRPNALLRSIYAAEKDFLEQHRDGDHVPQYWRKDVAGLYCLAPGGSPAIKLIELSLAAADDRCQSDLAKYAVPSQFYGYWYRAIRHADEDPNALDPKRFAFCAFPDNPSAGKYMYILDEEQRSYRTLAQGRRGIDVFPTREELKTTWTKID